MKRIGFLYEKIYDIENLRLADKKARKGKSHYKEIKEFDKNREDNLLQLQTSLKGKTFTTSPYTTFYIKEKAKKRLIYKLPYFPDRIVHHAIMNILEPYFVKWFTTDTYSCIKNKGIHRAHFKLIKYLKDEKNTQYCLKIDVEKFYPSINNIILKQLLRKKVKDNRLLSLLDNIINSVSGIPIGNYLSQYFANFYLNYFDHWIKEKKRVKYYLRYCDDMVFLCSNKRELHLLLKDIREYLKVNLNLNLKGNYQVFPVIKRGIDFVGYVFYHTHILLRKSIKNNFIKMIRCNYNQHSINSYYGWLKYCNSLNLKHKYLYC